jgi:carnitine 3-dehydrogenase
VSGLPERPRVAILGCGVIGTGWAGHFLRAGYDVIAWDPSRAALDDLPRRVRDIWPTLERAGLAADSTPSRLVLAPDLATAVADADFVQESGPEILDQKAALFEELTGLVRADAIVATSSSGLLMTDIQARCAHAARTVVGHPFHPVYLVPLVEVVGGDRTDPSTVDEAAAFYRASGKEPLVLDREVPGFIGNRLMAALWREALYMISSGEASPEQIDAAVVSGPGLRWSLLGPVLGLHFSGGPRGIAGSIDHFYEAGSEWSRLRKPPMTDELRTTLVDGAGRIVAGRSEAELTAWRDAGLLRLLAARNETSPSSNEV